MRQVKTMKSPVKPNAPRIKHLMGANRVLVIAPHGLRENDNNTDLIAEQIHKDLGCFAVINTGFRRPDEDKGETSDLKKSLLDLGKISDGEQLRSTNKGIPQEEDFLGWIDSFLNEISKNHGEPFVVHIHGIDTENIKQVASLTNYRKNPDDLHVLVGYGQTNAKNQTSLTATKNTVDDLIKNLSVEKINATEAPVVRISINGKRRGYCGSESDVLNQYLRNKKIKGQSIQLEIREAGFRDKPEIARKTAESVGKAIGLVAGCGSPAQKEEPLMKVAASATIEEPEVWTTLSEKSEEKRIKVKEIDLSDTRFKSRVSEYGVDQDRFNDLVASIKSLKILNNIIVNKAPGKTKYQLISGFRRMAALEKVYEEQGRKEEFPDAEVPARVFKSLTDEQALRISFSENLARKDLTTWEVANQCRMIADELTKRAKSPGEIEAHLAAMINKDGRTVRRYLALSAIKNEGIRRDLHTGRLDASIGIVFTREGLKDKDREALHRIYRISPMPFRSFDALVANALRLKEWSGMTVESILAIPAAKEFLLIPPDELKERAEYLMKARNKPLAEILANETGYLKHSVEKVKSMDKLSPFAEKFYEKAAVIRTKISKALETKKMVGEVAISPVGEIKDKMIKLAVAAPVSDIKKVVQLALKEMDDDIPSLENLFKKPPKPSPTKEEVKAEKKISIAANASIAFTMRLSRLQDILKDLASKGAFYDYGDKDERKDQVLVRTVSDTEVEFGRCSRGGLLIQCEAEILRKGSSALLLKQIHDPITKLAAKKDTVCEIQIIPSRSSSSPSESKFILKTQETTWTWDTPFFEPEALSKFFDKKRTPKATMEIRAYDLKDMMGKVMDCINPNEVRRSMTGIFLKMDSDKLLMAGTNGLKLFEAVKPHLGLSGSPQEVLLRFDAGRAIRAMIRNDTVVRIEVSPEGVSFKTDGVLVVGDTIRGENYPDYTHLFNEVGNRFSIPLAKLREVAANLAVVADKEDIQRMTIKTNGKVVSFLTKMGKAEYSPPSVKGAIDVDVNAQFLSDLANAMDGEQVEVRHSGPDNYITFYPDSDGQRALLSTISRRAPEKPQEKTKENKSPKKSE
jgi:DNA polymerase III sliding clamp (beta) subunit (PCNA family)/ParB-like chromosome segregation protein Spo0J